MRISKKTSFSDIAYQLFARSNNIAKDIKIEFNLLVNESNRLFKFEHIAQTGGSNLNDLLRRTLQDNEFLIPAYKDLWVTPRIPKEFLLQDSYKVVSAHYLNGSNIKSSKSIKSFTIIRDPRKIIMSSLQNRVKSNINLKNFWRDIEKNLLKIKKGTGHISLQLYEISSKNNNKRYPYVHGGRSSLINFNNLVGTTSKQLLDIVYNRLEDDLIFVGITENLSESLILICELLGIEKIKLWRPGLFGFRKIMFEESPPHIQELIEELCADEILFYKDQKNILINKVKKSRNLRILQEYYLMNKRPDLKFIQSVEEKLELAKVNNDNSGSRLKIETVHVEEILSELNKILNLYK